ncbi:hypothetical protein CDIK_3624 [Cucumispora dikerogammari]|nr:hypothetical protein CDIK_3624 [Cucumispora dikerogammari]
MFLEEDLLRQHKGEDIPFQYFRASVYQQPAYIYKPAIHLHCRTRILVRNLNRMQRARILRNELGILGERIQTTVFIFRYGIKVVNRQREIIRKITLETEPFSLSKNEDGYFVINQQVKFERCIKASFK